MALTQAPSGCAVDGNEEEKGARRKRPGARSPGGQGEGASCVCVGCWFPALAPLQGQPARPPPHTHNPVTGRGPNGSSLAPLK